MHFVVLEFPLPMLLPCVSLAVLGKLMKTQCVELQNSTRCSMAGAEQKGRGF